MAITSGSAGITLPRNYSLQEKDIRYLYVDLIFYRLILALAMRFVQDIQAEAESKLEVCSILSVT